MSSEAVRKMKASCWLHEFLPSQRQFCALTERVKGFSGPVGSGKSAALCFEATRQAYLNGGRQGLLAAPTFSMLRDATLNGLMDLLAAIEVEYDIRKSDGELDFVASESLVLLRSLEEPERLRGTNLAWFAVDELSYTKPESWLRLEARLRDPLAERLSGFGVWTPQGHDWVYKKFIHEPVAGYGCVRGLPFENRFLLERTPDYYERLESSYDPRFYKQEALGEYINSRADRVYHCFNRPVHVVAHHYDAGYPLIWALDFNVSPMSSVIAQIRDGRIVVLDEIVLDRATTEEACSEFENRYRSHFGVVEICGDASGRSMKTSGANDYNIVQACLYKAGFKNMRLRVPSKNPPVLSRVQRLNAVLTNALGEVRMEVDPRCKELIKDFEEVLFKSDSGVIDKFRDPKRTHASDALGYLVWELYGDKQTAGEMNKRLL